MPRRDRTTTAPLDFADDVMQTLSNLEGFKVLEFNGVCRVAADDIASPTGTKKEFRQQFLPAVVSELQNMGWCKETIDEAIMELVERGFIELIVRPVMQQLHVTGHGTGYSSDPTTNKRTHTVRKNRSFMKDFSAVFVLHCGTARCLELPPELWKMIKVEFLGGYYGHGIRSRDGTRNPWNLHYHASGTVKSSIEDVVETPKRMHEMTEILAGACLLEHHHNTKEIFHSFFQNDIVFPRWNDLQRFIANSPSRVQALHKFSLVLSKGNKQADPSDRSHNRCDIALIVGDGMNATLEELAKAMDVQKLILSVYTEGEEYLVVFLRQVPADTKTDDHYNWLWVDQVAFRDGSPRPPPADGFKPDGDDVTVADATHYAQVMKTYAERDSQKGDGPRSYLRIDNQPALVTFDSAWISPDHDRFKEAERIMKCPTDNVQLASYNMSVVPDSARYISRVGGSTSGAETHFYTWPYHRVVSPWKVRGKHPTKMASEAADRALWRVDALGSWDNYPTKSDASKAILRQASGVDVFNRAGRSGGLEEESAVKDESAVSDSDDDMQ